MNRIGSKTDPCGTPHLISLCEIVYYPMNFEDD